MKRVRAMLLAAALLCLAPVRVLASTLALPAGLTSIEAEAFAGDTSVTEVVLPDTVVSVGDDAFNGCSSLGWITIPGAVETIGEGALDGCQPDLLIRTDAGSAAMAYAQLNGVDYQANTRYRALLIAQSYENVSTLTTLYGPKNDVAAMSAVLPNFANSAYEVTIRRDLSASGILSAITSAFGGAAEQDVSLFYYSGHGMSSNVSASVGALVGTSTKDYVTAAQLRSALAAIPGRKIVIIDACYSGNFIVQNFTSRAVAQLDASVAAEESTPDADDFVNAFISAFAIRSRGLSSGDFYVLVAAADSEKSYEGYISGDSGPTMGLFTGRILNGAGYSALTGALSSTRPADVNGNGVLTLDELYQYTMVEELTVHQHAQVYPTSCDWFGVLRG